MEMGILVAPHTQDDAEADMRDASALRRVLLVDRQPLFLEALRSLLGTPPLGALTEIATRSDDAVATALAGSADLVVCDVLAEPLDGHAVVRALADLSPRVPVILLGDITEITAALPLMLDGAAGLFTKDVSTADLLAGVEAVLAGHQAIGRNLLPAILASGVMPASSPVMGAAARLSPAEREVLAMVGRGKSVAEIASVRQISQKTVRNHMASIYRKLDLKNRVEAMLFAARIGLVSEVPDTAQASWADGPPATGTPAPGGDAIPIAPGDSHWDHP
jgi:DNA-binding NarL/FixJ family response regulator